ncbi:MAG: hypothetical protein MJZ19_05225 [Paludibacteraceae bacterium]|nr:hypothetical protein [Paludibacteraceae bacterium]
MRTSVESILNRLSEAVKGTEKDFYSDDELVRFAEFYLDKWDENTSEDVIAESLVDFFWNDEPCRRCSYCGKLMRVGYCVRGGDYYFCSDECLHTKFTPEEWNREYESDNESYYTEWI